MRKAFKLPNGPVVVLFVSTQERDERPGVMFAEMELIGIPHRVTIGERGLKEGAVEIYRRSTQETVSVPLDDAYRFVRSRLDAA